ncbi:sensor histidine kinase [Sporosarcina obsidiansis]|uniref:sensor histidine kinase n=1 Tax=Sporosarcina obsidiansis TaxID=2660748 RepID=UPI00129A2B8B|nr:GHKL domain-containing protein [Sporosarcina obsidiansis]
MTTIFFFFGLFNFVIIYGPLFYIMNLQVTIKRLVLCLLVNTFVSVLAATYPQSLWIPMVVSIVVSGGLFYLFSRQSMVFFHLLVIYLFSTLAEYMALFLVEALHLSLFIHSGLIVLQIVVIVAGYKKLLTHYEDRMSLSQCSQMVLLLIAISTGIVFYVLIFMPADIQISAINLVILFFYFVIMIILTRIVLHTMMKEQEITQKFIEQQQFTHYMQTLEQVNRDMQTFRHDHANILLSLRGYIESEDVKGLRKYFDEQIVKVEQRTLYKNQVFSQLDRLQLIEIKGLISTKLLLANELSIPISVEIPDVIEDISINRLHLSRVLGILLDNAIEASTSLDDPQINLAFLSVEHQVIIVIENRLLDSEVSIQQLFTERYSTKREDGGLGLPSVRRILAEYPNSTWNSRIENQWFIHEIIIDGRDTSEGGHL